MSTPWFFYEDFDERYIISALSTGISQRLVYEKVNSASQFRHQPLEWIIENELNNQTDSWRDEVVEYLSNPTRSEGLRALRRTACEKGEDFVKLYTQAATNQTRVRKLYSSELVHRAVSLAAGGVALLGINIIFKNPSDALLGGLIAYGLAYQIGKAQGFGYNQKAYVIEETFRIELINSYFNALPAKITSSSPAQSS